MSHVIRFKVPLTCLNCGALNGEREIDLYTSGLNFDYEDASLSPGEALELDFDAGFFALRVPSATELAVFALEVWSCRTCRRVQFAQLRFDQIEPEHWRFLEATAVRLSSAVLDKAHYISRRLDEWRPGPGDDAVRVMATRAVMNQREFLANWEHEQTSLRDVCNELAAPDVADEAALLSYVSQRAACSALADPGQSADVADEILEQLLGTEAPAARLAVLDLVNAFLCAGVAIRPDIEARARRGLSELAGAGPPLALRIRVAFAAIVYGEFDVAERLAPCIPGENTYAGETFPNDVLKLLGYLILLAREGAVVGSVEAAWRCVAESLPELFASEQLDPPAVLWLARVIYQHFGKEPVGQVAARAHAFLWASASRDPLRASTERPEFPLTDTLARGAFRVERHLQGKGAQTLWLGRDVATAAELLVACDGYNPRRQDVEALRRLVGYRVPGVFELAYVGAFDPDDSRRDVVPERHWAIVERVTEGGWLPHVLGPADPWSAPKKAIELGRSAGRILVRAAAAGVNLTRIRPELMWAKHQYGYEVTGLSPRAMELFQRTVGELPTWPLFMYREYHAPEIHDDPDDRAVAYSLAVMVAEWATGRFPLVPPYYLFPHQVAAYVPIEAAPRPLAQLLEATIRIDRGERPRLAEFVDELERMSL